MVNLEEMTNADKGPIMTNKEALADNLIEGTGSDGLVFPDNKSCEDCDNDIHHCCICGEDYHSDDFCRHLFEDAYFEVHGAGTGRADECLKKSIFKLLRMMPAGFTTDLKKAIESGKFHTWIVAPMIGGGGILQLYGMAYSIGTAYGDALIEIGESEQAEETRDGYHWLVSLYDADTADANRVTVNWLDERLVARTPTGEQQEGKL